jgi:hippurate hydrolase
LRSAAFAAALAFAAVATPALAEPFDPAAAKTQIQAELDRSYPRLDVIYKDLHRHPELGFQEVRSAKILAGEMRKLGFEVTEGVGKTGVVAVYRNGAGPTVMVRTELDALPVEEKTNLPYASHDQQVGPDGGKTFVMHACGHDVHMAWWLGTAEALVRLKDRWHGTLVFVAQPAEEVLGGAKAMVEAGLFTRFPKPDYAFAAHVGPAPAGMIAVKQGVTSSASDALLVTFNGRGSHGSAPQFSIDPVVMGARFVTDVQTVISREKDPAAFGVVTVGSFQAGTAGNIIPDKAVLRLSLRSFTPEVRQQLMHGVEKTAQGVAEMAGAPAPEVTRLYGTGPVINDPELAAKSAAMLQQAFGRDVVLIGADRPGFSASEDFSVYTDAGVRSVFYWVGGYDPKVLQDDKARGIPVPINHSPEFAPAPEPSIRTGAEVLALSVMSVAR